MLVCTEHKLTIMDGNLTDQTPKVLPMAAGAFYTSRLPSAGAIYGIVESYDLVVGGAMWEFVGAGWDNDGWENVLGYNTAAWSMQAPPWSNVPMRWMLWTNTLAHSGEQYEAPVPFTKNMYLQFNCGENVETTHPVIRCWLFWEES